MSLNATLYVHNCNDVDVSLNWTEGEAGGSRWLSISCENRNANLNLFFKTQEDQDAVLGKLYKEFGKLQPKN